MFNKKLVDSIQRSNILIKKMKDDCVVPTDRFYGDTAKALISIRQKELDRIIETHNLLCRILQEET